MSGRIQRVLLLGPDDGDRRTLHLALDRAGKQIAAVSDRAAALRYLASEEACDVVIAPGDDALALAAHAPVIAIVHGRDLAQAQALLDAGVADVVGDPIDEYALMLALRRVKPRAPRIVAFPSAARPILGDTEVMQRLRTTIEQIAKHRTTVLVLGESGTGKELVARAIHEASPRREHRFVAINCAAIPAALLESELFGHVRGAFTDAVRDKAGLFQDADGGTLFLDEIGELPLGLQAKLLRVLQEGEIRRVGDTQTVAVDVRLVCATLRDLGGDVAAGRFREDLYYRINVLPIRVPALRERADDIPLLARFFARRVADRHHLGTIELTGDALATLQAQPWPGNVRELENVIERTVVLADGPVDTAFLTSIMTVQSTGAAPGAGSAPDLAALSIKKATRDLEADLIARALAATAGNRTNAAKLLEISHRALLYKMKEYGIT